MALFRHCTGGFHKVRINGEGASSKVGQMYVHLVQSCEQVRFALWRAAVGVGPPGKQVRLEYKEDRTCRKILLSKAARGSRTNFSERWTIKAERHIGPKHG